MAIKLNGSTSGSVALDAPADTSPSGTDVTLTLPTSAGSSGQYLQTNGTGGLSWQTVATPLFESVAVVTDQKSSGTSGGTNVINSWTARDLNHELFDPDGIVSLSSNQFTLGAGTYYFEWKAPFHYTSYTKTILYNVTDSATVGEGEGGHFSTATDSTFWLGGVARVTITGSKAFEIRYNTSSAQTSFGLGISTSRGSFEYYTTVRIFKEA